MSGQGASGTVLFASGSSAGAGVPVIPRNTEIELKLSADPKGLARIRRTPFWSGHGRAQTRVLDSVYFDTVDHKLRERGFTLRVRKVGGRYMQTLKSSGKGGYFQRLEFEAPVADGKPNVMLVEDPTIRGCLADIVTGDLKPIFTTHVRRSRKIYRSGNGATVEIALDDGEVRNEYASAPLTEIELELKQGTPETLFEMAQEMSAVIPLRLQIHSKPDLGYVLGERDRAAWQSAGKLSLDPTMSSEESLDAIVDFSVSHILRNDLCARGRLHFEGVHQVRVGLRRLRSGLDLFRNILPTEQYRWIGDKAKSFAVALGPARDFDVFREEILPPVAARLAGHGDFAAIDRVAARLQDEAYATVREALSSQRFTSLMIELMRWRKTRSWRNQPVSAESARLFAPIGELAEPLLAKRHKAVTRKGAHFADLTLPQRHEVRIAVKKLRYATDFFASLYPARATRSYLRRLGRLQDDLGHLNDIATLGAVLGRVVGPDADASVQRAAGALLGWYERDIADGEGRLVGDWRAFEKARPFWKA